MKGGGGGALHDLLARKAKHAISFTGIGQIMVMMFEPIFFVYAFRATSRSELSNITRD